MELRPYQKAGIEFLVEQGRAILADDPGLGKTVQALRAAQGKTLVICPPVLCQTWEEEAHKWGSDLDLTVASYQGSPRREKTAKGGYRTLPKPRQELVGPWDTVICDESHYVKNHRVNQTKVVEKIAKKSERLYLLTGTPVPNWSHEIYMPLRLLHPNDKRFSSYWRWIGRWFDTWKPPWGGTEVRGLQPGVDWDDFVKGNELDRTLLRRERDEVLSDLPPLTEQEVLVDMVPAQAKVYRELKRDYVSWTEQGTEISAWSAGDLHAKLAQICTGLDILEPATRGSGKLDAVREMLADRKGSPTVLFCHFRATADELVRMCDQLGLSVGLISGAVNDDARQVARRAFQRGELDVLVGTLATASEGITLTAADTCIFVERSWRPSLNIQAMRRIHRMGQTRPCTVVWLITRDTVDERLTKVLESKMDDQVKLMSAIEFARLL